MCDSKRGRYCPGREPAGVLAGRMLSARSAYLAAVDAVESEQTPAAQEQVARTRAVFDESYTRYAGTRPGQKWLRDEARAAASSGNRGRAQILSRFADRAQQVRRTGQGVDRPVPGEALVPTHCHVCGQFTGAAHACTGGADTRQNQRREADVYDVDGTLLDSTGLTHLVERGPTKDLPGFHSATAEAPANEWVVDAARASRLEGREVIVLTARSVKIRPLTAMWLARQTTIPSDSLVMRADGDYRPAAEVKQDAFTQLSRTRTITKAVDDTPEVISMWERKGVRAVRVPRENTGGVGPDPTGYRGWLIHPDDVLTGLRHKENRLGSRAHPVRTTEPHVTLEFGKHTTSRGTPDGARMVAVGYARNGRIEALVVSVDGTTERPDGGVFHVTLSRQAGVRPVESNDLLTGGWVRLPKPFRLRARPFSGAGHTD